MKRAKIEQIKSAVAQYLRRRHYQESEIHGRSKDLSTDLGEMSVRKRSRVCASIENSLACSSISGDFNACDQQFSRLRKFVLERSCGQCEELSSLLFPVFVHMYSSLLSAGPKTSAHKFHERHHEIFHLEEQKDFVRSLRKLDSKAELQAAKDITEFRDHRYTIQLSHASVAQLLTHLKASDNMIILQIINQHIHLQGTNTQGRSLELHPTSTLPPLPRPRSPTDVAKDREEKKEEKEEKKEEKKDIKTEIKTEVSTDAGTTLGGRQIERGWNGERGLPGEGEREGEEQLTPAEEEQLGNLRDASIKIQSLSPTLPSILFCAILNSSASQGLCTSTISPNSELLCGGFEDCSIQLYRLQPVALPATPMLCSNSHIPLAADYIYHEESERQIDIDGDSEEGVVLLGHNGPVYRTHFTPDSSYLLSCSRDRTVRLWDIASRTNTALYQGHSAPVWDLDYCPVTNHFATSSRDQTVKLWALDRVCPLRSFIGHEQDIEAVTIHPNGNYVASGSADRTVRLWCIQDGKCLRTMCGHRGPILTLTFSPDGLLLASAGEDRRVYVWDLNLGTVLKELRGHTDTVYALAFSPCSKLLASGGQDCVLRLWDVRRGEKGASNTQIEGHTSSELLGAYPTKSAILSHLSFPQWHLLYAVAAS